MECQAATPKLNKTKLTLKVGKSYTLKLKNAKKVTWKSKDKKIAKISSTGKVTGVKAGTDNKYTIQILAPKDMVTLDDIVNYVLELNPGWCGCRYSYYYPVQVGGYYFYHLTVEVSMN